MCVYVCMCMCMCMCMGMCMCVSCTNHVQCTLYVVHVNTCIHASTWWRWLSLISHVYYITHTHRVQCTPYIIRRTVYAVHTTNIVAYFPYLIISKLLLITCQTFRIRRYSVYSVNCTIYSDNIHTIQ